MRVLLSWLREYLDLSEEPETISNALTRAGIEVDRIEKIAPRCSGVVTVRIIDTEPHPNDSGLCIAAIFDGKNSHRVVCGAPNCRKGMLSAFAPVGSSIFKGDAVIQVKRAEIKQVESFGCLCSEQELGLTTYGEGIIELGIEVGEEFKEGQLLEELFSDIVFEVSLTPNLGHCLSVMGIARELGAFLNRPLKKRPWMDPEQLSSTIQPCPSKLEVTITDPKLCPRYSGLLVEGISITPSPLWMRLRLERSGIRSINNVVDITNYVMHDLGQPLHAFDADKIENRQIVVRSPAPEETLLFLDGQTRTLQVSSCVIADAKRPLALGGVMGGQDSAVSQETSRIVFEAAFFPPSVIRKGRNALALHTDSSRRFERGTDPSITLKALQEALSHLPSATAAALCDVRESAQVEKISCRISKASALLGYEVSANEIESAFNSLGLACSWDGQNTFTVTVPSFRHDLHEEVDLIEEIGRLVGLQKEPQAVPKYSTSKIAHHPLYFFEKEIRKRLLAEGLQEVITCNLISPSLANIVIDHPITADSLVKVLNPLSTEQSILRPSLLPGMIDVLRRNINQRTLDLAIFEVGHSHLQREQKYQEPLLFGILLSGQKEIPHFSTSASECDFFDLKGILENLFSTLGLEDFVLQKSDLSILHPGRQAKIYLSNVHVGMIGELHPSILRSLDIEQRVFFAECDIQELWKLPQQQRKMAPLPHYPSSERDWTITLSKEVKFSELLTVIQSEQSPLLENVSLIALFEHEKLGANRHNITLRFVYRDKGKTVSQEEVDSHHDKLVKKVSDYVLTKYPQE
jgi:phenylalanyl-tRNA synthetase beta chain